MPYTAEHKQETRTRIVKSARRLFNRNGFADVSIDEIMGDAGLTHGGFYKHFAAKEDLYQAAVLEFICAERPEPWQARHIDPVGQGRGARPHDRRRVSRRRDHFDDRDGSCPMIALPSDVSRGNGAREARLPPGSRNDGRGLRRQSARRTSARRARPRPGAGRDRRRRHGAGARRR